MADIIPISTARAERQRGDGRRLERAARDGELVRLRRGAYIDQAQAAAADPVALHRARVVAARLAAVAEPTFSHESAAALHGIPLLGDWPLRVHTTVAGRAPSNSAVQRSLRPLGPDDCVVLPDGLRATSPARTAIDLAATRGLLAGIVAISHVRATGVDLAAFAAVLDRAGRFPGVRRARLALARSTAGSRSVLETLAIVRCQDYGFALPVQQLPVTGVDGVEYVVDLAWQGGRVLADGDRRDQRDRLGDPDGPDDDPDAIGAIRAEQRRARALGPVCRAFVRFDWADAWGGQGLARRLIAAGVPRPERRLAGLTF